MELTGAGDQSGHRGRCVRCRHYAVEDPGGGEDAGDAGAGVSAVEVELGGHRSPEAARRTSLRSTMTRPPIPTETMRQAFFFALLLPLTLTLTITPAAAQDDAPDRWAADVGFSLNTSGGNERLTMLTSEVGLSHLETSVYRADVGGRFRYGRSEGEEVARNLRGTTSIDILPEARWSPFLFATAENDPFKKLEARLNGGSGVKRTFWRNGWGEVSLSGAALYSYENLTVADSLGDGISQTARWSWRARARKEIGDGRRLEHVTFYQPEWDDYGDYLLESRTSARWTLTRSLAFLTTFLYERDSTPAPDIGPYDWSLVVGLSMATKW